MGARLLREPSLSSAPSQAARYSLREPDARVTAIDIRETSLRHTRGLQRKYSLRNLDLHRLGIGRVSELGQTFDKIVCTDVFAIASHCGR